MENDEYFAEVKTLKHGFNAKRIGYKWGLYDDEGFVLMRPLYDYISIDQEGRIWARYKGKMFFVKENKLPYQFDYIHDSEIDKEWYVIESNGCFGVVDNHLKTLIPMKYKYIIDYGGLLWTTNIYRIGNNANRIRSGYIECTPYTYEGTIISKNKYDLLDGCPTFPIISNENGFNLIIDGNKELLSTPAKKISKINDWYIIEYENQHFLYDIKNNIFLNKNHYSTITQWKRNTNIIIGMRMSGIFCDVYKDGNLFASFNFVQYSLVDVVDEFIIVQKLGSFKYGFIGKKGLIIPCLYDKISCFRGAVNIIKAELFEETSKEKKEGAVYVEYKSSKHPGFYVIHGRYDIFSFDGHCICENNDITSSNLLWNEECDHFYIKNKYIEQVFPDRIGTEATMIKQYDSYGETKRIDFIKEAYWSGLNNNLVIKLENGSSVSIPSAQSKPLTDENTKTAQIFERKVYSQSKKGVAELLNSDYKPNEGLSPKKNGYKWGYINESGETVIPFEYDGAQEFSDGLAAVKKGDLFGYIDYNNKVVINFQFIEAGPFNEGLAKFDNNPMDNHYKPVDNGFISKDGFFYNHNYKWRDFETARAFDESNRINYAEETWWAMTDGMYGDYPGSGVDYDTIGFGI